MRASTTTNWISSSGVINLFKIVYRPRFTVRSRMRPIAWGFRGDVAVGRCRVLERGAKKAGGTASLWLLTTFWALLPRAGRFISVWGAACWRASRGLATQLRKLSTQYNRWRTCDRIVPKLGPRCDSNFNNRLDTLSGPSRSWDAARISSLCCHLARRPWSPRDSFDPSIPP